MFKLHHVKLFTFSVYGTDDAARGFCITYHMTPVGGEAVADFYIVHSSFPLPEGTSTIRLQLPIGHQSEEWIPEGARHDRWIVRRLEEAFPQSEARCREVAFRALEKKPTPDPHMVR
jgi:hypothetical protein